MYPVHRQSFISVFNKTNAFSRLCLSPKMPCYIPRRDEHITHMSSFSTILLRAGLPNRRIPLFPLSLLYVSLREPFRFNIFIPNPSRVFNTQ